MSSVLHAAGQVTSQTYPDGGNAQTAFTYDNDGTVLTSSSPSEDCAYTYDLAGRITSVVHDYSKIGLTAHQELDYVYTPDGFTQSMTWKNGSTTVGTWSYGYDQAGRMTSVHNPWNEITYYSYDGEGMLSV